MGSTTYIYDDGRARKIGSGIYGEVKRANYLPKNIPAAIKIIDLNAYFRTLRRDDQEKNAYIEKIKERIDEMKKLEGNNYENINFNKYYENTNVEDGKLIFAMELCDFNLKKYLEENKANEGLDIGEIYEILKQLNNTFQIMSSQNINIIHGNLKLENILIKDNKTFKLTGFEIIPELIKLTKIYQSNKICQYLPPEILRENYNFHIDQKTDLWSLGIIIYYLAFGEFPFKGETSQDILLDIRKNKKKKKNFRELDDLIDGLLKYDKDQRLTWGNYFNHPFFKINGFWRMYKIINKTGEGQFSTVYKAITKDDKKNVVAIKLIDFNRIKNFENNVNYKNEIIKEINEKIDKNISLGNDHPDNFVKIYEKFESENGVAFSMELCECNLKAYINSIKEVNSTAIFFFLVEMNKIFRILEKEKIIIGDLKLENILLKKQNNSPDFIYKLGDVGLCPKLMKFIKYSTKKESLVYLPPELCNKNTYESNSDLWNLGIILHYFRFKRFPYEADSYNEIINQINSGQKRISSSKNSDFNILIGQLLQRSSEKRLNWEQYFNHSFFTNKQYNKFYEVIGEDLSEVEYYSIYFAKEKKTGIEKVLKIINKEKIRERYYIENNVHINEEQIENLVTYLIQQTKVMKILEEGDNQNTIKFYEYFNTESEFVIVMEKCDSDLSHYFNYKNENYDLKEIKDLLMQLNNTFKIMQANSIIHGDLNLKNILYKKVNNKFIYKLTDYGVSKEFLNLTANFLDNAKPEYTAPEVLNGEDLTTQSDLWSLGVILYTLLFRKEPYKGKDNVEVLNNILYGQDKLNSSSNPEFDHLLRKLLTANLSDRITWEQYFDHPFLVGGDCWKYYTDERLLGDELYFKVFAVKLKDRDEKRAIKVINLKTIKRKIEDVTHQPCDEKTLNLYIQDFIQETDNMELLRGPNKDNINALIFYEYFQTENEFCIVQELCDGNIQHLLEKKKTFKVKEIFQVLKQLNNTFHILLDKNLSHKNLRLDNILYRKNDKGDDYIYKLTGLEFNRKVNDLFKRGGVMLNEKYKAPEILISEFSSKNLSSKEMNLNYQKADLWSLGVIIFILYFGVFPFKGNKPKEIYSNILKNDKYQLNEINDPELKDLLTKLLTEDKDERINWKGYFNHKFFSKEKWKYT